METLDELLLKGPFPEIRKMKKEDLAIECSMWRRIWQWMPSEVKYYVARTGQLVAVTMRNYQRHLGRLLQTHWNIEEIELGIEDKVYDTATGDYYYEKKTIRTKLGGVIDFQIIHERKSERALEEEQMEEAEQKEQEPPE